MSVQLFNKMNSENQPFHIYYDMNVINNDSSFPSVPVRFNYKETRSNAYLYCPQDYFMSIVRFNLQTPTLPVFVPQIDLNPDTNFGGTYPIQSMSGASNTVSFPINMYTNIPIPVNSVLYLSLSNGALTSAYETCAVNNNYYRCINSVTSVFGITTLTLLNSGAVAGVPNSYQGGTTTAFSLLGGTIQAGYAVLNIANLVYNPTTQLLTLTFTPQVNLLSLITLFNVNDGIYINNSGQYNGSYIVRSVLAGSMTLSATENILQKFYTLQTTPASPVIPVFVNTGGLLPYVSGGRFTSAGDFYNITPYKITLEYSYAFGAYSNQTRYTQAITYIPNDLTTSPPRWNPNNATALSLDQITSEYYWVYTYEVFIKMVNQAFINAFWGTNGAIFCTVPITTPAPTKPWISASGITVNTYQPPSMSWNQDNLKAIINADNQIYNQISVPVNNGFIYFNTSLSTLFDSFPYQYPNVNPNSNLYSYIVFDPQAGAGLYIVSTFSAAGLITPQYTAIQVIQDHQTASLMNPVQSVSFTSTLLPVVVQNVGQPLILNGTAKTNTVVGSTANVFPIVTDFQVPFSAMNTYVPDLSYVPSSEYRLVDLYGESPCNQIDIQVFWKDQYGILHPFLLGSGCSGNLKVLFRRKDFADVNLEQ